MSKHTRKQLIWRRRIFVASCLIIVAGIIVGAYFGISAVIKSFNKPSNGGATPNSSISENKDNGKTDKEPKIVSSAVVISTGDIMVHSTQLDGAKTNNGYDFTDFFKYIKPKISAADLAVGNLEVTFGGTEAGKYSGYPAFNTPDSLADVIKDAGFDLMLTTNNHCYDTGLAGLKRTLSVLTDKKLDYVGTKKVPTEKDYVIKNINGIKLGITAFSYENKCDIVGRKSLNGNIISAEANDLVNTFNYDKKPEFYARAKNIVKSMKSDGADKVIFYMHWGEEYQLKENAHQDQIAQELSSLGVDIIIGSHPHVIEPVKLLYASGSDQKTVCVYSMGNAISNQRQEIMHPECVTGHTEDGMLITYKFDKYSDGSVVLSDFDIVPTWVNKYKVTGVSGYRYSVIPLETADSGSNFDLSGEALNKSNRSFMRTKEIISEGLTEIQNDIGCKVRFN